MTSRTTRSALVKSLGKEKLSISLVTPYILLFFFPSFLPSVSLLSLPSSSIFINRCDFSIGAEQPTCHPAAPSNAVHDGYNDYDIYWNSKDHGWRYTSFSLLPSSLFLFALSSFTLSRYQWYSTSSPFHRFQTLSRLHAMLLARGWRVSFVLEIFEFEIFEFKICKSEIFDNFLNSKFSDIYVHSYFD